MNEVIESQKDVPPTLMETNMNSQGRLADGSDNLAIFVNNITLYCKLVQHTQIDSEGEKELRGLLKGQLNQLWFQDRLKRFSDQFKLELQVEALQPFEKKLYELEQIIRAVAEEKNNASSEQRYVCYQTQVNSYIQHLEAILASEDIIAALNAYEIYDNEEQEGQQISHQASEICISPTHHFKELINCNIHYGPQVFHYIRPQSHKLYISEAAKSYEDIVPFKIKNISLSLSDSPIISCPNYFNAEADESKTLLTYCIPNTNKMAFYSLADVVKVHSIGKQYYQERQLSNQWSFTNQTRNIVTPNGKIYAINCRTTKDKIDSYLYQITETKASNRGPLPAPRRQTAILYLNNSIYFIGGQGDGQKCSRKNYRYSIKDKKWHTLSESNVALRKPTVCTVSNRYIIKLGGFNQFDYINKVIQMYDSLTDKWSLVRASPRNILQQVQILQDSHALQINDDQIYIFGGKNSNKFNTDTGFILLISQIREKKKGAAKVTGEFWNVSIGKRNILTSFGQFSASSILLQHNCIYGLRTSIVKALSP